MILGISKIDWIGQLPISTLDQYLEYVDNMVVALDPNELDENGNKRWDREDEWVYRGKVYYRLISYSDLKRLMNSWSCCKAYPRKVLWSNHFAVQEISEGLLPKDLERKWLDELEAKGLVQ